MLTFKDNNKSLILDGYLIETITNYDFNVTLCKRKDQRLISEFGKELNFIIKLKGRKNDGDRSPIKLLKSPAIMASGVLTIILPSNSDELCDRIKLLLKEKQAGNNSDIIDDESLDILDKLLEYKCKTEKQYKQVLFICNVLHIEMCSKFYSYVYIIFYCLNV